jgi:hypothetical protein
MAGFLFSVRSGYGRLHPVLSQQYVFQVLVATDPAPTSVLGGASRGEGTRERVDHELTRGAEELHQQAGKL